MWRVEASNLSSVLCTSHVCREKEDVSILRTAEKRFLRTFKESSKEVEMKFENI
jgi:hypothetical protein